MTINIYDEGKPIGSVNLVNGKLQQRGNLGDMIDSMREYGPFKLTDEQVYRTLPHRMTGHIQARVTKDESGLLDRSFINELRARAAPLNAAASAATADRFAQWAATPNPAPPSGPVPGNVPMRAAGGGVTIGHLQSPTPGRTDSLSINVPSGAYVMPADIVSGLGEGNTQAGAVTLERLFPSGEGESPGHNPVPILAAGGEYVISPSGVIKAGGGNLKKGHDILDAFVKRQRAKQIKTLKGLPGPER